MSERRFAERQKLLCKTCPGLFIQLNWELHQAPQGSGKCLAFPPWSFSFCFGGTQTISWQKAMFFHFIIYVFLERQFSYSGLFHAVWEPGSEKGQGSPAAQACRADALTRTKPVQDRQKQDLPTQKQQK